MGRDGARRQHSFAALATVASGVLTYVFLAAASRSLDDPGFDAFSVFWSLSLLLGFGMFMPIEQELARVAGAPTVTPAVAARAGLRIGIPIAAILAAALLLAGPPVVDGLRIGGPLLLCAVGVALASPVQFAARGYLIASRRVTRYAGVLLADGALRTVLAVVIAVFVGARVGAEAFGVALVVAVVAAHFFVLGPVLRAGPVPLEVMREVRRGVVALLVASLAAQVLLNAGPVLIQLAGLEAGVAGAFQVTFNAARIPLFVLVPLQALLVAPLAGMVRAGLRRQLDRLILQVTAGLAALTAVGTLGAYFLGPWAIELVFGADRSLPAQEVAGLVAGVCAHIGLVLGTQALVASGRHRIASAIWLVALIGATATLIILAPSVGMVSAAVWAFGLGSTAGFLLALADLRFSGRTNQEGATAW